MRSSSHKYPFAQAPDVLGLAANLSTIAAAADQLRESGFVQLPITLDAAILEDLRTHLASQSCRLVSDDPTVAGQHAYVDFAHPKAEMYQIPETSVLASPTVRMLLIDQTVLRICQEYLGAVPKVTNAVAWYSFPRRRASDNAAQMFHFDMERIKWLKVFFFLTDVNRETGAHVFIPGTHKERQIPRDLLDMGYDRMSDDAVGQHFDRSEWLSMEGPAGSVLIEDTRGLHKGTPLSHDHRLVLQFQYSLSYFGSPSIFESDYHTDDPTLWEFAARYPGVFGQLTAPGEAP